MNPVWWHKKVNKKNQVLIQWICRKLNQQFSIQTQNEKEVWFQLRACSVILHFSIVGAMVTVASKT